MGPPPFRSPRRLSKGTRDLPDPPNLDPGLPAPVAGYYRAHDASGHPSNTSCECGRGEVLPPLPTGFTGVLMDKW
jgi:hypothetical protein